MHSVHCDIAIVGAGPAGLSAAIAAAECRRSAKLRVVLIDENADVGGQIWRGTTARGPAASHRARALAAGVDFLAGASVISASRASLELATAQGQADIRYEKLVIATGARELFLPFPGWTLPGVVGVGGLQALMRSGWDVRGRRILVSGSGPLLLAVSALARQRGASVVRIVEQAPPGQISRFVRCLWRFPHKLIQGAALRCRLSGVAYDHGSWITRADGEDRLRAAEMTDGKRISRVECDILATGFGLVPNTQFAAMLGCRIESGRVLVGEDMSTSIAGVFAAGEVAGVGGVDCAVVEGAIAGLAAAGDVPAARSRNAARRRARRFAKLLDEAFALRREVRSLAAAETVVCRCEDVTWERIRARANWRDAKLQTRCGMGPCQGRVCGPAISQMTGWTVADARPPLIPVPIRVLSAAPNPL